MAHEVIVEGSLGLQKKKGVEPRYFVLYEDRLDYFKSEDDRNHEPDPRGCLKIADIQQLEEIEGGFSLNVLGQQSTLMALEAGDEEEWIHHIRRLLRQAAEQANGSFKKKSKVNFAEELVEITHQYTARPTDSDGAVSPHGNAHASLPDPPVSPPAAPPAAPPPVNTLNSKPSPGQLNMQVVCSGVLNVERKGKQVAKYFILLADRLLYYETEEDSKAPDSQPRGSVMLSEVLKFEELPMVFL